MKFSQRIGKMPVRISLQIESIDDDLRTRIWNVIVEDLFSQNYSEELEDRILKDMWIYFFNKPIDEIPSYSGTGGIYPKGVKDWLKKWFFNTEWYRVYDLIEFLGELDAKLNLNFVNDCNSALEKGGAGYRLINATVTPITSEVEIKEIEEALSHSEEKYEPVSIHLKTALSHLSNRESPDYRNSIKESISSVEALCKIIAGDEKATLSEALKNIEIKSEIKLHGALTEAFNKLYGYTSDKSGIRHALIEEDVEVTYEDAKFMLVACSAFVNYLIAKFEK
jgi:hypothetical protein